MISTKPTHKWRSCSIAAQRPGFYRWISITRAFKLQKGVEMGQTVLVTGGSGFVASHLIDQLLAGDDLVHATVRSPGNRAKIQPLEAMQRRYPGRLRLFEANLLRAGSFDAAMEGC